MAYIFLLKTNCTGLLRFCNSYKLVSDFEKTVEKVNEIRYVIPFVVITVLLTKRIRMNIQWYQVNNNLHS